MLIFLKYFSLFTTKLTIRQSTPHNNRGILFRNCLGALMITSVLAMSLELSEQTWANPNENVKPASPQQELSKQESTKQELEAKPATTQKSANSDAICVKQINPQLKKDQTVLNVTGMVCAFCVQGIEIHLKKLSGIKEVNVDLEQGKVVLNIEQTTQPSSADLCEAIKRAGYTVTTIEHAS